MADSKPVRATIWGVKATSILVVPDIRPWLCMDMTVEFRRMQRAVVKERRLGVL